MRGDDDERRSVGETKTHFMDLSQEIENNAVLLTGIEYVPLYKKEKW